MMQKTNEDCYYFLTSSCAKGLACAYRHNPVVLTSNVICPAWLRGNCVDLNCSHRHSNVPSPITTNGVACYYEKMATGCLKHDCTFVHSHPRSNSRNSPAFRPSSTNLVNKDVAKSTKIPTPSTNISQTNNDSFEVCQIKSKIESPPINGTENKTVNVTENVPIETIRDDRKSPTTTRVVANRNVVNADSNTISIRKVVQPTTNRVIVSSNNLNNSKNTTTTTITTTTATTTNNNSKDSDSDIDLDEIVSTSDNSKQKNVLINIPFPCSTSTLTNRLFSLTKSTTTTNDTKPIRLNRESLPAPKTSNSTTTNEEKINAGTNLSKEEEERRKNRIERFKKNPISNAGSTSANERKRLASDQTINESPSAKRLSSQQEIDNHQHRHTTPTIGGLCQTSKNSRRTHDRHDGHRRRSRSRSSSSSSSFSSSSSSSSQSRSRSRSPQRKSPIHRVYSLPTPMNQSAWYKQVDEFLAKTMPSKPNSILRNAPQAPVPLLSLRPQYVPPIKSTHAQQPNQIHPKNYPRQSYTNVPRTNSKSTVVPSQVTEKRIEQVSNINSQPAQTTTATAITTTAAMMTTTTALAATTTIMTEEDENKLLENDASTDVVDTFACIDEVLLETDNLLELI